MSSLKKYIWILILPLSLLLSLLVDMRPMQIQIAMNSEQDGVCEFYYGTRWKNLNETNTRREEILKGENEIRFNIPAFFLTNVFRWNTQLRLDPTIGKDGIIDITSIRVNTYWKQYDISSDFLRNNFTFNGIQPQEKGWQILNDDPQILIPLEDAPYTSTAWKKISGTALRGLILALILALFYAVFLHRHQLMQFKPLAFFVNHGGRYMALWLIFFLLVSCGITLSNFGAMHGNRLTDIVGETKLLGNYQLIRSDEYLAHGLLPAIQQYNHEPRFPRQNSFIGLSGRNYLMLHDTGAPVTHISMLSKPTVWGFFFFDLRHGLSWLSLFPIFFGIFSFQLLLDTLFDEKKYFHLLVAIAGVFTINSAAWSFWPVYNVAGSMLAVVALLHLLQTNSRWKLLFFSMLIGWCGSVSALSLYYPRVWYGGLLAAAVLIGGITQKKLWHRLKSWKILCGLAIGFLIFVGLMYSWYCGVKYDGAFDLMSNSIYPGQRRDMGGCMASWTLFSGWIAPYAFLSAFSCPPDITNQCEVQEPMLLLLPLLIYLLLHWKYLSHKWMFASVSIFLIFLLGFCYFHYPLWLIKLAGLERGNHFRADYMISLGQIFLLAILVHSSPKPPFFLFSLKNRSWQIFFILLIALSILLPPLLLWKIPPEIIEGFSGSNPAKFMMFVFFIGIFYCTITWMLFYNFKYAVICFLSLELLFGVVVNPICIAPKEIRSDLLEQIKSEQSAWHHDGRVMICNSFTENSLYASAGGKVFNAFFEYEDPVVFELLFKNLPDTEQFHRLNHMVAYISDRESPDFNATIPAGDAINLFFNGKKYDFSKLPIDYLLNNDSESNQWLHENASLHFLDRIHGFERFHVLHKTVIPK